MGEKIKTYNRGFSLVELLIAMAIAAIVGMAGFVMFSSSNWSHKVQEDISGAQQSVRLAMDRLAKDVRSAGFGLPDPPFSITIGVNPALTSPITITNSTTGFDTITILGIGYEVGTLDTTTAVVNCGNGVQANLSGANCIRLSAPAADSIDNFFNSSGTFQTTRVHISLGGSNYIQLAAAGHNQANRTLTLGSPATLDRSYADGTSVYIIQAVQYTIATDLTGCSATNPCMASNDFTTLRGSGRQVLAENIEDMQFAYGIDVSPRDGKMDDTADGTVGYAATDFLNAPTDPSTIITIRANIVGRTRNQDPKGAVSFRPQCFEDRPADSGTTNCTGAPADGYRRRMLTKILKIRNPRTGT